MVVAVQVEAIDNTKESNGGKCGGGNCNMEVGRSQWACGRAEEILTVMEEWVWPQEWKVAFRRCGVTCG